MLLTLAAQNQPPQKNEAVSLNKQTVRQAESKTVAPAEQTQPQKVEAAQTVATQPTAPAKVETPAPKPMQQPKPKPVSPRVTTSSEAQQIAKNMAAQRGWIGHQWNALESLWGKESNWEIGRLNKSSLACGIAQSYPCSKIYPELAKIANDKGMSLDRYIRSIAVHRNGKMYLPNPNAQLEIAWGGKYITERYGTPSSAYAFWLSKSPHWY